MYMLNQALSIPYPLTCSADGAVVGDGDRLTLTAFSENVVDQTRMVHVLTYNGVLRSACVVVYDYIDRHDFQLHVQYSSPALSSDGELVAIVFGVFCSGGRRFHFDAHIHRWLYGGTTSRSMEYGSVFPRGITTVIVASGPRGGTACELPCSGHRFLQIEPSMTRFWYLDLYNASCGGSRRGIAALPLPATFGASNARIRFSDTSVVVRLDLAGGVWMYEVDIVSLAVMRLVVVPRD
jgi:hypothetical protein